MRFLWSKVSVTAARAPDNIQNTPCSNRHTPVLRTKYIDADNFLTVSAEQITVQVDTGSHFRYSRMELPTHTTTIYITSASTNYLPTLHPVSEGRRGTHRGSSITIFQPTPHNTINVTVKVSLPPIKRLSELSTVRVYYFGVHPPALFRTHAHTCTQGSNIRFKTYRKRIRL